MQNAQQADLDWNIKKKIRDRINIKNNCFSIFFYFRFFGWYSYAFDSLWKKFRAFLQLHANDSALFYHFMLIGGFYHYMLTMGITFLFPIFFSFF